MRFVALFIKVLRDDLLYGSGSTSFRVSTNEHFTTGTLTVLASVSDELVDQSTSENTPPPPLDFNSHLSLQFGR